MRLNFKILHRISFGAELPSQGSHAENVHVWIHDIVESDPFLASSASILSDDELAR
jgi:hypothetical protein